MARGKKTGGRVKGSINKKTEERIAEAAESGLMPLDYMLQVMRDEAAEKSRRDYMANAAAPYLHPKLSSVELANKRGESLKVTLGNSDAGL